ncbi:MAG: hypothetical protein JWO51_3883 [Rhodospirillales bacterium]|nr:hypothetical protein [Rhodospirillales bacterium]
MGVGISKVASLSEQAANKIAYLAEASIAALAEGNLQDALRMTDRAVRLAPADPDLQILRATVLMAVGLFAQAISHFRTASLHGGTPTAELGICSASLAQGDTMQAAETLAPLLASFSVEDHPQISEIAGRLCRTHPADFPGWATRTLDGRIIGWTTAAAPPLTFSVSRGGESQGLAGESLPTTTADGAGSFALDLRLRPADELSITAGGKPLLGSPLTGSAPADIEGSAEFDDGLLSGFAWAPRHPSAILTVRLLDDYGGEAEFAAEGIPSSATSSADLPKKERAGRSAHGFSLAPHVYGLRGRRLRAFALLPPNDLPIPLTGNPIWAGPVEAYPSRDGPPPHNGSAPAPRAIDIVVPVYGGRDETVRCIASVIAARRAAAIDCEIIVIDDCSPDEALVAHLSELSAAGDILLHRNAENLGFPATVNVGLALHGDRDVMLLNSDTLVYGDWLTRLRQAAYARPDIATVTPFSNEASILSYPAPYAENSIPSAAEGLALDTRARMVNAGQIIDIPTAVGFCMYIRRDCLNEVGPFDSEHFGRGYGEENDFCERARLLGWHHVAATDVFVTHFGGRSFGSAKRLLVERNSRILNRLHPGYDRRIRDFIAADPLLPARRRLDLARRQTAVPAPDTTLIITLDLSGGVARHVEDVAEALARVGRPALVLKPHMNDQSHPGRCVLVDPSDDSFSNLIFDLTEEFDEFVAVLADLRVRDIEIHHTLNLPAVVLEISKRLAVPYEIIVHDYSWICPRITLMDGQGRYCGMPETATCERCIELNGSSLNEEISVGDLRNRSTALFAGAARVITPCADVRERFQQIIPNARYETRPWEKPLPDPVFQTRAPAPGERLRVAVVGAIGQQKGYEMLLACGLDAALRDLPLEFVVIGYSQDDAILFKTGRIFVTGRYEPAELIDLIRAQNCHLAFLPSATPETWSYSLTEIWHAGLPVLAFDLGAVGERIRTQSGGWLIPVTRDERTINDFLLDRIDLRRPAGSLKALGQSTIRTVQAAVTPSRDASPPPGGRAHNFAPKVEGGSSMDNQMQTGAATVRSTSLILTLSPGLYLFSVGATAPSRLEGGIRLPAVQIVKAPGQSAECRADFLGSDPINPNWLGSTGEKTVLRILGAECRMLVTTFRGANDELTPLPIECRRLDTDATNTATAIKGPVGRRVLSTKIIAHIQQRGDVTFSGSDWAGSVGQRLWIEAFTIIPVEDIRPEHIEYKAVIGNGQETPWVSGGIPCGTKGQGMPITGFVVRLRGPAANLFDCDYKGTFFNAGIIGPVSNGAVCGAAPFRDPLERFQLTITERAQSPAAGFGGLLGSNSMSIGQP